MKTKLDCYSQVELARKLEELNSYFSRYGLIPTEEKSVALPQESVVRIRFDGNSAEGVVDISIDW
ncbi:MAG: hypothetical protein KAX49_14185 [Halanaerobiales bacterium]|nr:hypothetical protein [Halanaerobiales bacterium]